MTDGRHIPQEDLAAYAMQALSPAEASSIREHLSVCPSCKAQLAEVSGELALVAMSVDQQPVPEGARQRFLERISADAAPVSSRPSPRTAVVPIESAPRRMRWPLLISWGAVAALLLFAVSLETRIKFLNQQLQQQAALVEQQNAANARAKAVLDLLTAPTAQHVVLTSAKTRPAPTARAVYLASQGSLILQASNLDPVPANKIYELWVIPTQGPSLPAGTFRPDAAGNANLVLPDLPKGVEAKAFGVTIEDAGGSATPTLPIVLQGAASSAGE